MDTSTEHQAFIALKKTMDTYAPISAATWSAFKTQCAFKTVPKHTVLLAMGEVPTSYAYVYSGLCRIFIADEHGGEYNKNFFAEGSFPGSMTALLNNTPSRFAIATLEPMAFIDIDFRGYRNLLLEKDDLKLFQIYYLEKNWLLSKDSREVEMAMENATQRYRRFLDEYPALVGRLAQHHIASHLSITPTQLSRIRKNLR